MLSCKSILFSGGLQIQLYRGKTQEIRIHGGRRIFEERKDQSERAQEGQRNIERKGMDILSEIISQNKNVVSFQEKDKKKKKKKERRESSESSGDIKKSRYTAKLYF